MRPAWLPWGVLAAVALGILVGVWLFGVVAASGPPT